MNIKKEVSEFVRSQENNTYNYRQVAHAIGVNTRAQQRQVAMLLVDMAFNGEIIEVSPGKYKTPRLTSATTGTFVRRSNGKNSVVTDPDGETLFVAERNSMHALNGDKVRVMISAARKGVE
ncbi:MAG: ribonuclease R, partial [Duncaniella sp.]|nr:ribonuclease R [Duncaniella sp.]